MHSDALWGENTRYVTVVLVSTATSQAPPLAMSHLSRAFTTLVSLRLHTLVVRTAELFASQRIPDLPHIHFALAQVCLETPGFLDIPPAIRMFIVQWIVARAQVSLVLLLAPCAR